MKAQIKHTRRRVLPLLLAALLAVGAPGLQIAAPALAEAPTFTILLYLCGTDLESDGYAASYDLIEIAASGLTEDGPVRVVVETGGTREWGIETIDPGKNQRWLVADGDLLLLEETQRKDMGDAQTLRDFILYGTEAFPADRYGLILWDHGGGATSGVCFDEYTEDYLTLLEISGALAEATDNLGRGLDFVGFDACLMATYEMATYLSPFAAYMIASEELEPGLGWDYEAWLRTLIANPALSTEALLSAEVDAFMEACLDEDPDDYITLSVIDLGQLGGVYDAVETLSADLARQLEGGNLRAISNGRQGMRAFGSFSNQSSDMVDLLQLARTYADLSDAFDLPAFERAMDAAVVYSRHSDNLEDISGLSILMPLETRAEFYQYGSEYDPAEVLPNYTQFITGFTEILNGGDYVFSLSAPEQIEGSAYAAASGEGFDEEGAFAYSLALDSEQIQYLSYVEGNLMLDISDEETEAYVDLGYLQDTYIDWEDGVVYSMFDGSWPTLEGQLINMIDQSVTAASRRGVIDVTVNDKEVYLLVIFDANRPGGEVVGYTQGYNELGLPVRGHERLREGDVIVPQYPLLYFKDGEQVKERFAGDPIVYTGAPLDFGYTDLRGTETNYVYAFCLNDIFGGYQFSEFIGFEM